MDEFNLFSAEELISNNVIDATGNDIGEVKDFILDPNDKKVKYMVISQGGVLGTGLASNYKAVPFNSLEINPTTQKVIFSLGKDLIFNSPDIDYDNFPINQENILLKLEKYYGENKGKYGNIKTDAGNDPYYSGKRHYGYEGAEQIDKPLSDNSKTDNPGKNLK
jgi:sporulation protein YlmC with PRC-barrel domain